MADPSGIDAGTSVVGTGLVVLGGIIVALIQRYRPRTKPALKSPAEERAEATAEWRELYEEVKEALDEAKAEIEECQRDRHELIDKLNATSRALTDTRRRLEMVEAQVRRLTRRDHPSNSVEAEWTDDEPVED